MHQEEMKRIEFVSDRLVEQIVEGRKMASVADLGDVEFPEDEYNSALVCGDYYHVYDSRREVRCTIRIVSMELCRWDAIPERLWRGETNKSAKEFRDDHVEYFGDGGPLPGDFEFIAYYFELVSGA